MLETLLREIKSTISLGVNTLRTSTKDLLAPGTKSQKYSDGTSYATVRILNDPMLDIAMGRHSDKIAFHRFGFNATVPNGTWADIWAYGPTDPSYNWLMANEKFRIAAGGDANDTSSGSGARSVVFLFLDPEGNLVSEELPTNGASASASTALEGRRFIRASVGDVGTFDGANVGPIVIEGETTGSVVGYIDTDMGQTQLTQFTVYKGYTAYLSRVNLTVSTGTNKDADIRLWQRPGAYIDSAPFKSRKLLHQWPSVGGYLPLAIDSQVPIPELTDIFLMGKGNGATTSIDGSYDLKLVKN